MLNAYVMEIWFFSTSLQIYGAIYYPREPSILQRRRGSAKTRGLWPVLQWSGSECILPHHQQGMFVTQHLMSTVIISRVVVVKICVNCYLAYICWGWSCAYACILAQYRVHANVSVHTGMKHAHAHMIPVIPGGYFVNTCFIFICLFDLQLASQLS